jgi:large subunit ribosomal protein L6
MSRLIKKSITLPQGVTITENEGILTAKGPKGEVVVTIPAGLRARVEGENVWIEKTDKPSEKAMAGTFWSLTKNAIVGVSEGFVKVLEIEGVGYRVAMEGNELVLHLGYALPVRLPILSGVTVTVEKNVMKVSGVSKDFVGRVAAEIRALKKPEPYKGKGIHYQGEVIRRKAGKKAGASAA